MGRHDEAMAEIRQAEQLNPQSAVIKTAAGMAYFYARQHDQALDQCRQALELDPGLAPAHRVMRGIYVALGRYDEAFAAYRKEKGFSGDAGEDWPVALAQLQAIGGRRKEAQSVLKRAVASSPIREGDSQPFEIAISYALLGDRDNALGWLAKAEAARSFSFNYVLVDSRLDNLRSDPRFVELVKKAGLQN